MNIKFYFVEENTYRMNIKLPDSVLSTYCLEAGVTEAEVRANPDLHASDIANHIATHYESLGDSMEFVAGDITVYEPELTIIK